MRATRDAISEAWTACQLAWHGDAAKGIKPASLDGQKKAREKYDALMKLAEPDSPRTMGTRERMRGQRQPAKRPTRSAWEPEPR